MADAFAGRTRGEDVQSDDEQDQGSRSAAGPSGYGGAKVAAGKSGKTVRGRGPIPSDPRKYRYDVVRGKAAKVPFGVTRDDRMSAEEAGGMLHSLHVMFGIDKDNEDVLHAFDCALWFCHTVNGGSVLNPGRSTFVVPGRTQVFDFDKVRDKLGTAMRRFFRAFADDIAAVNKRVLDEYDPYDPVSYENWGWLMQVASARGLQRFPYLAHDSADACLSLSAVERSALASSKTMVISSTPNSADKLKANDRTQSADGFDSTVGA